MAEITTPDDTGNWQRRVIAPDNIPRPSNEIRAAAYFYFFRDDKSVLDFERLYEAICNLTIQGKLGHYAGISDDGDVMAIHHSNADDQEQKERIQKALTDLGIVDAVWREKLTAKSNLEENVAQDAKDEKSIFKEEKNKTD